MSCGVCDSPVTVVLDMGEQALAGAFLKPDGFEAERKYPLRFGVCESCGTAQVVDKVAAGDLFSNYFYRSSQIASVRRRYATLARDLVQRFQPQRVLEIGCNDGALLREFQGRVPVAVGIDPNAPADLPALREYFTSQSASDLGEFDMVVANHVFAHNGNIRELTEGVRLVLAPRGVFVMECHYLGSILAGAQYDAIYHEHSYYHSLTAFERHLAGFGLKVFHVEHVQAHGGSIRFFIDRGERAPHASVHVTRQVEFTLGWDRVEAFRNFATRADTHRYALTELLRNLHGSVAGYGASGRANTLIQWCGIELDYIVDDSAARRGMFTPGSHIPVVAASVLEKAPPDYVLALAWTYLDDIKAKCNRPLVVPFPRPRVMQEAFA